VLGYLNLFLEYLVRVLRGGSNECMIFFESLPGGENFTVVKCAYIGSISRLLVGVVLKAPSADLTATYSVVLNLLVR